MLTLSEDFIREAEAGTSKPVVLVEISGATPSKFVRADRSVFGYPANILEVTARQSGLDVLTCEQRLNTITVDFMDDGDIRDVIKTLNVIGKTMTLTLGFDTGDDTTFPENSYAPYSAGIIDRWESQPGLVRLILRDVRATMFDRNGATIVVPNSDHFLNGEPPPFDYAGPATKCLQSLIAEASINANLYDTTTYAVTESPLSGHLTVDRRLGRALREKTPVAECLNDIGMILRGYNLVQEGGDLVWKEFDASATPDTDPQTGAATRFLESDIIPGSVKCSQDLSQLVYGVTIETAWTGEGHAFELRLKDAQGEADWQFSDGTDRITDLTITDDWFSSLGAVVNAAVVTSSATTIDMVMSVPAGGQDSPDTDGGNPNAVDSDHPGYIWIRGVTLSGEEPNTGEIIKYTTITKTGSASERKFQISNLTRGQFGTTARDHNASLGSGGLGPVIRDITAVVRCAQEIIKRFREGALTIEFRTPLHKYAVQLADIVYIESDVPVRFGLDGLSSGNTTPFECVQKEADSKRGEILWKFVEVRTSSHTSVLDRFGGTLTDKPNVAFDTGTGLGSLAAEIFSESAASLFNSTDNAGGLTKAFIDGSVPSVPSPASLEMTIPWQRLASRAGIVVAPQEDHTFTASKDTYVDAEPYPFGLTQWTYSEVANGAGAPATTAGNHRAFKVVTDATSVTSVTDLRDVAVVDGPNLKDEIIDDDKLASGITGSKFTGGAGALTHLSSAGIFDSLANITTKVIDALTDGTYAKVLAAAISSGKINLAAGSAGLAGQLPTAQIADASITERKLADGLLRANSAWRTGRAFTASADPVPADVSWGGFEMWIDGTQYEIATTGSPSTDRYGWIDLDTSTSVVQTGSALPSVTDRGRIFILWAMNDVPLAATDVFWDPVVGFTP